MNQIDLTEYGGFKYAYSIAAIVNILLKEPEFFELRPLTKYIREYGHYYERKVWIDINSKLIGFSSTNNDMLSRVYLEGEIRRQGDIVAVHGYIKFYNMDSTRLALEEVIKAREKEYETELIDAWGKLRHYRSELNREIRKRKGKTVINPQEYLDIFKRNHSHLTFGAFGAVRKRDIEAHLANNTLVYTGYPQEAIALYSKQRIDGRHRDFTQREIVIPAGDLFIREFAADDVHAGRAILRRCELLTHAAIWLEIFEEDKIAKQCAADYQYIMSKVTGSAEIKGLYVRDNRRSQLLELFPITYDLPEEELASIKLIKDDFLTTTELYNIKKELANWDNQWADHYSNYNKRKSWTAFCLQGYDADDPGFIIKPSEMTQSWKAEHPERMNAKCTRTKLWEQFPTAAKVADRLPFAKDRVRFMRLRHKDGELARHSDISDRTAGLADGMVARLHIPIITSDATVFHSWSARGEHEEERFSSGSLFYLDQRKPHAAYNTDPTLDRVHFVIDCYSTEELRSMLR